MTNQRAGKCYFRSEIVQKQFSTVAKWLAHRTIVTDVKKDEGIYKLKLDKTAYSTFSLMILILNLIYLAATNDG